MEVKPLGHEFTETPEPETMFNPVSEPRHTQLTISGEMRLARIDLTLNKIGVLLEAILSEVRDAKD